MNSLILRVISRVLYPLLLLFSLFLLFRGHNAPGGGFVGGLVAAAAVTIYAIAHNTQIARDALRLDPHQLIAAGLLLACLSGALALFWGQPFMTGLWSDWFTHHGKPMVGTALFFDIGVFLTVIGVTLMIVFAFAED